MEQICASDLHLGYEYTNYDKVCKLFDLAESESDKLILCGDTFDLWRYPVLKIDKTTMVGFKEVLNSLKETSKETNVVIIPGNHDYNLNKVWQKVKYDYKVRITTNNFIQSNIYYTHGWEFDIMQRLGSFAYSWIIKRYPYLYQRFFKKPSQMGRPKDDNLNFSIEQIHNEAEKFRNEHNLKYIVMGHTHLPGMFGKIINCGDFIDSCSYVSFKNNKPKIKFI